VSATSGQFWTQQFLMDNGTPYAGVRVFHYVAGATTTNLDVFQDAAMASAHNNPVVGDTAGRVFFYGSGTYRLLVKSSTADGNLTLYDWDPVELVHHTATVRAEDKAVSLPAATAASRGRLFGTVDGGGDVLKLWLQKTSSTWGEVLSLPLLTGILQFTKGTDAASTTNVTLLSDGNFYDVTGVNPIESMTAYQDGTIIWTRFTGAGLTLTQNSTKLVLPGAVNYTTIQNEIVQWISVGAGIWVMQESSRWGVAGGPLPGHGIIPIGIEMFWPVLTPPAHWIRLFGQAISRTTYAAYFALIGTTYGAGDGSTTFNVPPWYGRTGIGVDTGNTVITSSSVNGANAATVGGLGGAETHTLTTAQMPAHTHGAFSVGGGASAQFLSSGASATVQSQSTGGGGAHSNTQPWMARAVIAYMGV